MGGALVVVVDEVVVGRKVGTDVADRVVVGRMVVIDVVDEVVVIHPVNTDLGAIVVVIVNVLSKPFGKYGALPVCLYH